MDTTQSFAEKFIDIVMLPRVNEHINCPEGLLQEFVQLHAQSEGLSFAEAAAELAQCPHFYYPFDIAAPLVSEHADATGTGKSQCQWITLEHAVDAIWKGAFPPAHSTTLDLSFLFIK